MGVDAFLLIERVIPPGNAPSVGKWMDLNMLVATGGRERTEAEYRALGRLAGFEMTRLVPTTVELSLIEAAPGGELPDPPAGWSRRDAPDSALGVPPPGRSGLSGGSSPSCAHPVAGARRGQPGPSALAALPRREGGSFRQPQRRDRGSTIDRGPHR